MIYSSNSHTQNTVSTRGILAGIALAAAGHAYSAEPPLGEADFPHTRKAVCEFNKVKASTPLDYKACEAFMDRHRPKMTDQDKIIAVNAGCLQRHKLNHVSFYDRCRSDLYAHYKLPVTVAQNLAAAPAPSEKKGDSAGEACAKGAAVGAATVVGVHALALAADFLGCAGACTAAASAWTIGVKGAVVVGCVGGVAHNAIEGSGKEEKDGYVKPPAQRPAPK